MNKKIKINILKSKNILLPFVEIIYGSKNKNTRGYRWWVYGRKEICCKCDKVIVWKELKR